MSETGPWSAVLETELGDSRQQDWPLQIIALDTVTVAQFIKFEALECWGKGCGLQYFDIQRN